MRTSAWIVVSGGLAALLAWSAGVSRPATAPVEAQGAVSQVVCGTEEYVERAPGPSARAQSAAASSPRKRLPLLFAENRGQVEGPTRYLASMGALTAHLLDDRIALRMVAPSGLPTVGECSLRGEPNPSPHTPGDPAVPGANVHLRFEGADPSMSVAGRSKLPTVLSYFRGNDPARWVTRVPCYSSARYSQPWPGIDVVVRGNDGRLEYDLLLEPGADLEEAVFAVDGTDALRVDDDGSLLIETAAGTLSQPPPRTWETLGDGTTRTLACRYRVIDDGRFGFDVPGWSGQSTLVVDPVIVWGSYLGGSGLEEGKGIAVALDGAVVVGGEVLFSADFPATPGAFDSVLGNQIDGFVARFSPGGESLEMAAYVGGNTPQETVHEVHPMSDGTLIVQGGTASTDFPVTPGAFSTTFSGVKDLFVMRISHDGGSLLYSTLLGGDANDISGGISIDTEQRAILTGTTYSTDFPITANAAEPTMDGHDMFVTCLSADGSSLEYSSFVSWAGSASFIISALDTSGGVAVAGKTNSSFLPVTPGAFDASPNGLTDVFVIRLDAALQVDWCTYLGGTLDEAPWAIAVDGAGSVFVSGVTNSITFPTSPGCFDPFKSGIEDAFITKLSSDGSTLEYSTYLGGTSGEKGFGLAVDEFGCAVVVGESGSTDFPTAEDALPLGTLPFLARLSPDGTHLWTSTLLGDPTSLDDAFGVALGPDGSAYVTGYTWSAQLPGTAGSFDDTLDGNSDCFVLKVDLAAWTDLGQGMSPIVGPAPRLTGRGELLGGNPLFLRLTDAPPNSLAFLVLGLTAWNAPFKGGTLVPAAEAPFGLALPLGTDAAGTLYLPAVWSSGIPHGIPVYAQYWLPDPTGPHGFTATNAVVAVTVE